MSSTVLSVEDLLEGAAARHHVAVPAALLGRDDGTAGEVVLRPLTVRDVRRVTQAAKDQKVLASVLMVQQALVEPQLTVEQVSQMPAGLVRHLLDAVNRISGLDLAEDDLDAAVRAPMARACFVLGREFGWTPAECADLTVGQVLLYLEMIARGEQPEAAE